MCAFGHIRITRIYIKKRNNNFFFPYLRFEVRTRAERNGEGGTTYSSNYWSVPACLDTSLTENDLSQNYQALVVFPTIIFSPL